MEKFWELINSWVEIGWTPALHGFSHQFETECGGINPVNNRSEFAGVSYERQAEKIREGVQILEYNNIFPEIFFAPAHTFDENTIKALKAESDIRIISDTIANDVYYKNDMYFIPQQSGKCRKVPFKITTFCYHPNIMDDTAFEELEQFLINNNRKFIFFEKQILKKRKKSIYDLLMRKFHNSKCFIVDNLPIFLLKKV